MKQDLEKTYLNYVGKDDPIHRIAFGGPITFILRQRKALHLLKQSLDHTTKIIQNFDQVILDHHIIRDTEFPYYLTELTQESKNLTLFNKDLLSEMAKEREKPLVLEINRENLFKNG